MHTCTHIELSTDNPRKARDFYAKLFGWKIEAMPNPDGSGEYLMFRADENGGGGIAGKQMPGQPTAWMPYITVASVKASVKAAKAAGGSAILEYMSMGDMGAIGVIVDPTGGTIGLYEAGKPAPAAKPAAKAVAKPAAKAAAKPAAKAAAKPVLKAKKPVAAAKKPASKKR